MSVNEKMTAIADSIRRKTGSIERLGLDDMPGQIDSIQTGVELPELTDEGSANDLVKGKQLIDQEGKVVTGTVEEGKDVYRATDGEVDAVHKADCLFFGHTFEEDAIFRKGSRTEFSFWDLGSAHNGDVIEGKTFTSEFGLNEKGTLKENDSVQLSSNRVEEGNAKNVFYAEGVQSGRLLLKNKATVGLTIDTSKVGNFGSATPADVKKGKTFTSAEGYSLVGENEDSGVELPELTDEGSADDLAYGKELIGSDGTKVTGTVRYAYELFLETGGVWEDNGEIFVGASYDLDDRLILDKRHSEVFVYAPAAQFGDATPADVAKGKKFTSAAGYNATGEREEAKISFSNGVLTIR